MDAMDKRADGGLSAGAAAFEFAVVWATAVAVVVLGSPHDVSRDDWIAFAVLVPLIAGAHLLGREREKYQGSQLSLAPMFAAVLLLPPALAAAAIALAFVPDWIRTRVPWYIAVFNVANFVGPALAARVVFDAVESGGAATWTAGAVAALVTFLVLQYAVLAVMLKLARGVPVRETVRPDCVLIDAGLLSLGALAAALAERHPSLVILLALPLALDYRALSIPSLVEASRVEPKTGLFNVRHLSSALEQELRRAARFGRPLSLLMIDVDHLRRINTSLGHLAGDGALRLVATSLRSLTRDYDVAARFGGDEFCVLLPETSLEGALRVAERIREDIERSGARAGLELTVSIGVASLPAADTTPDDLIALADAAAYRAKSAGRNAVAAAGEAEHPVAEAERALAEAADTP
jgi:diguanylate cyclase (GGDEF)-like protein